MPSLFAVMSEEEDRLNSAIRKLKKENEELKQENKRLEERIELMDEKPFLKIIDDYYIKLGDEGTLFSMHKTAHIRSLMYILNRQNGYSELQCEYNDLGMKEDD